MDALKGVAILFLGPRPGESRGLYAGAALAKYHGLKRRRRIRAEGFEGEMYVVHYV